MSNDLRIVTVTVLPLVLVSCGVSESDSPEKIISSVIKNGRLSKLPESATDIQAYAWNTAFSGEWYLAFKASPADIQSFVESSESIKNVKPTIFDSERQYLPYPDPAPTDFYRQSQMDPNIYFRKYSMDPPWYNPTIKVKGKKYDVPPEGYNNRGEVIINDETNYVYIKIIWS
jgi:hypothetical protein